MREQESFLSDKAINSEHADNLIIMKYLTRVRLKNGA